MKPASRKQLVGYLQEQHRISLCRACRVIPISRKAMRYEPTRTQQDAGLVARLKALGEQYQSSGFCLHTRLGTSMRFCNSAFYHSHQATLRQTALYG